jgi:hypothetical protein
MLFRKLDRLYLHKLGVLEKLNQTYIADADPEVIAIRASDLQMELAEIEEEIKFEETMKPFVYMLIFFVITSLFILTISILKTNL